MASIGGVDLGTVTSESSTKSSNLFNFPQPGGDSVDSVLADVLGTSRTINIEGLKTGSISELRTFVSNIEALQNGSQSSLTFVSSWTNSNKSVLIQDFTHSKVQADENKVNYTLVLVEGNVIL